LSQVQIPDHRFLGWARQIQHKNPVELSAPANSGGNRLTSLAVQTTITSLSLSLSQVNKVPNKRLDTPPSPAPLLMPEKAFSTL
jgi:hypothetical protein